MVHHYSVFFLKIRKPVKFNYLVIQIHYSDHIMSYSKAVGAGHHPWNSSPPAVAGIMPVEMFAQRRLF